MPRGSLVSDLGTDTTSAGPETLGAPTGVDPLRRNGDRDPKIFHTLSPTDGTTDLTYGPTDPFEAPTVSGGVREPEGHRLESGSPGTPVRRDRLLPRGATSRSPEVEQWRFLPPEPWGARPDQGGTLRGGGRGDGGPSSGGSHVGGATRAGPGLVRKGLSRSPGGWHLVGSKTHLEVGYTGPRRGPRT